VGPLTLQREPTTSNAILDINGTASAAASFMTGQTIIVDVGVAIA
jgi:hypothetical protein